MEDQSDDQCMSKQETAGEITVDRADDSEADGACRESKPISQCKMDRHSDSDKTDVTQQTTSAKLGAAVPACPEGAAQTDAEIPHGETDKGADVPVGDNGDEDDGDGDDDESLYQKRDVYTTETFKIFIENLPWRFGLKQLKKRLLNMDLNPNKLKVVPSRPGCAFATFRCEEDRKKALETLTGHKWKGQILKASKAKPAMDPMLLKRKQEAEAYAASKMARQEEEDYTPLGDRLNKVVTPLWQMPYEEQLKQKETSMEQYLKRLSVQMEKNNKECHPWLAKQRQQYAGLCCQLCPIKPSPVLNNYRNKCEYTVGKDPEGKVTVGFRLSSYKRGSISVVSPQDCIHIPDAMKTVAQSLQTFVDQSPCAVYDPETISGHWSVVTLRTTKMGHLMVMVTFNEHNMLQDQIDAEKTRLQEYFSTGPGSQCGVTSLYFQQQPTRKPNLPDPLPELLLGTGRIQETLLDLQFHISPTAFFQINTAATEIMYNLVADWAQIGPTTTVLDVCCGTGTIGISMAKRAKSVIGIEMVPEAIEDAKHNATLNGVTNTKFYCGKAEDVLPNLMKSLDAIDVVAIVDPPRSGLHPDVVRALRRSHYLKRMVYVSCNPNGALQNFADLTRTTSKRVKGAPFLPVRAVPVDLFPHTPHCELVVLLERLQVPPEGAPVPVAQ